MDDIEFDTALISAAFALADEVGWRRMSVAEAARRADLPLARARARFPGPLAVLVRFGLRADQAALAETPTEADAKGRLFDLLMRRFDALQANRAGVLALLRVLPADPPLAMLLGGLTLRSMGWMLEGAGISTSGVQGLLRAKGLLAVWVYTLRAWQSDESADLSGTMAALDRALSRAERASGWLRGRREVPSAGTSVADPASMPPPEPPPPPPMPEPLASPPGGASEADPGTLPPP
jgi:AcrR family transcriptional regulator